MSKRLKRSDGEKSRGMVRGSSQGPNAFLDPRSGRFDITVMALFAVLVIILFHQFLFSGGMLFGTDSIPSGVFFRGFYRDFVRQYQAMPRWDPYILGGLPFVEAMHGDTFYPTSLLQFVMPLHRAMGLKLVLHVFLAGLFMYLFLKTLKLNRYAAAAGGLCYMFAPIFVSLVYAGHDAKMFVIALLPLCFYFLEKGLETKRIFPFVMLGGVTGLLILSSHVQMAYFALWAVGLYLLFRLILIWKEGREHRREAGKGLLAFIVAMALGLGVGLVQLLPPYVFVHNYSVRQEKTGYDHATSWSLHAEEVASLAVPEFSGDSVGEQDTYWGRNAFKLNTEYAGLIPLLLALLALVVFRSKRVVFFSVCGGLAIIYGLGADTPVFRLFYHFVPGVKLFRGPSMIMFLYAFAICLAGAVALHAIMDASQDQPKKRRLMKVLTICSIVAVILAMISSVAPSGLMSLWTGIIYPGMAQARQTAMAANQSRLVTGMWIAAFLVVAASLCIWARTKGSLSPLVFLLLLSGLIVADTWRVNARFIKVVDPQAYFARDRAVTYLKQMEENEGPFRVLPLGRSYGENLLGVHRLEAVTGFHDNELKWYNAFTSRDRRNMFQASMMDLMNVKYLLWDPRETAFERYIDQMKEYGRFQEVLDTGRIKVIRNVAALPRAWIAPRYEVADSVRTFDRLDDPSFDYRNVILLETDPGVPVPDPRSGAGRVEEITYEGNRIAVRVFMDSPGFLVLSDNYFPYWRAHVNGAEKKILRADYTLRAVYLESGPQSVLFTYSSPPFRLGAWISGLSILLIGAAALFHVRAGRGKKRVT